MSDQQPAPVTTPHFAPASGTGSGASGGAAAAPAPAAAATAPTGGAAAGGAPQLSASTAAAVASRGTPATLNLDDIFGDCFFTPEGDAVFLGDQAEDGAARSQDGGGVVASAEAVPTRMASRPAPDGAAAPAPAGAAAAATGGSGTTPSNYVPVSYGGGISTTGLDNPSQAKSTVMGAAAAPSAAGTAPAPKPVPFVQPPQQRHHLQYATPAMLGAARTMPAGGAKRKTSTGSAGARSDRKMSDKQKVERR